MAESKNPTRDDSSATFSAEERAAMKERAKELKAEKKRGDARAAGEADVVAAIAGMPAADRALAEAFHAAVAAAAPDLVPKTWYGMPAYARDGKVLCFFQGADKFSTRYATVGFNDLANLDDGSMWPTAYAVMEWTPQVEKAMTTLIERAVA
jgi:uncharacterized protein YdhG (YjbR/CyaY superfamily)